jgi:hypothetical protein
MIGQVALNREKWVSALMLDPETGLDPPGIRIRAVEGIDAASSFIQGMCLAPTVGYYRLRDTFRILDMVQDYSKSRSSRI